MGPIRGANNNYGNQPIQDEEAFALFREVVQDEEAVEQRQAARLYMALAQQIPLENLERARRLAQNIANPNPPPSE